MPTKDIVSSLRALSTSIAHTDITKSTLFQDAAAEIERMDRLLYEEKEKTRRLTFMVNMLYGYVFGPRDPVPDKTADPHHIDPDSPLMTE
jgi:hypothetical protein